MREALGAKYRIERADALKKTGLITAQIIQLIEGADLIVADLTGHNPNVHYELGVAHAREKQVIPMMMKGDHLPFDNSHMRTIFYSRAHPRDHAASVIALREAEAVALTEKVQNPVTHALGTLKLIEGDTKEQVIATVSAQFAGQASELAELRTMVTNLINMRSMPHAPAAPIIVPYPVDAFGGTLTSTRRTQTPVANIADMFGPSKPDPESK